MNDTPMMLVPVAIREEVIARLHFPADITRAEAEKISRVILAYAPTPGINTSLEGGGDG